MSSKAVKVELMLCLLGWWWCSDSGAVEYGLHLSEPKFLRVPCAIQPLGNFNGDPRYCSKYPNSLRT